MCGVSCSVASKQNLGLYAAAALTGLLLWPPGSPGMPGFAVGPRRSRPPVALGLALGLLPGALYFAAHGLLDDLLVSGFLRPFTGYAPTSAVAFTPMLRWWEFGGLREGVAFPYSLPIYWILLVQDGLPANDWTWGLGELASRLFYTGLAALVPLTAWWVHRARSRGATADLGRLAAPVLFGVAALASAFPRADFFHLISVTPALLPWLATLRGGRPLGRGIQNDRRKLGRRRPYSPASCSTG